MSVYFVGWAGAKSVSPVKIGHSWGALGGRIQSMQVASPFELVVIREVPTNDDLLVEAILHEHFRDRHIRGEWFQLSHYEVNECDIPSVVSSADVSRLLPYGHRPRTKLLVAVA